jgi:hypothetical protein
MKEYEKEPFSSKKIGGGYALFSFGRSAYGQRVKKNLLFFNVNPLPGGLFF